MTELRQRDQVCAGSKTGQGSKQERAASSLTVSSNSCGGVPAFVSGLCSNSLAKIFARMARSTPQLSRALGPAGLGDSEEGTRLQAGWQHGNDTHSLGSVSCIA